MSRAVGERYCRAVHLAIESGKALLTVSASGGARMQEGMYSLIQMARVSSACQQLSEHKLPHISLCTHPTSGGVAASMSMLGDLIIAEPGAFIGFAGPRVIEQTVREKLPEGFQRSEFLLKNGAIDMIIDRRQMRDTLHNIILLLRDRSQTK